METPTDLPARFDVQTRQHAEGPTVSVKCADPKAVVPVGELLPALRSLTNAVVDAAVTRENVAGRAISCKAGCGACCRQLVPLSDAEARRLPALIAAMEDAHRSRVVARFEAAKAKLEQAGLWSRLGEAASLSGQARTDLSMEYFAQGIPCPFLESEACSIHPQRPLICREYLVTSPAADCSNPTPEGIARVALAAPVFRALMRIEGGNPSRGPRLVPLIMAPFLPPAGEEPEQTRTVSDWMRRLTEEIHRINDEEREAEADGVTGR